MNQTATAIADADEVDIKIARIFRRNDGILCVQTKDNVVITVEDSKESYEVVKKMVGGKNSLLLSLTGEGATLEDKARDYWVAKRKDNPIIAEAVVAKSLAHKIIVNFVIKFFDAGRVIKMFTKESDAVGWLRSFKIPN